MRTIVSWIVAGVAGLSMACGTEEEPVDDDSGLADVQADGVDDSATDVSVDTGECETGACGLSPEGPAYTCDDGSAGGATGRCVADATGVCAWETRECPEGPLQWYETCGDPVCQENGHRDSELAPCDGQIPGQPCAEPGTQCDPINDCNSYYICTTVDPQGTEFGCPISRAQFKSNIEYVMPEERAALAREILGFRLATWQYTATPGVEHLGFIIEDHEPSAAIRSERDQVNSYAYSTMILAAVQEQQLQIQGLQEQIRQLEQAVQRCEPRPVSE
jgi:hypothetical protein